MSHDELAAHSAFFEFLLRASGFLASL